MNLWDLLDLPGNSPVALVGAGGKSSVMARLAAERRERTSQSGIILTSTTRLKEEQVDMADRTVYLYGDDDVARCRPGEDEILLVVNAPLPRLGKLEGVSPDLVCRLAAAWPEVPIIVEADGAAGAWFKVPGPTEPVIPACSAVLVAVSSLSAFGSAVDPKRIHRWDRLVSLFKPAAPPQRLGPLEVAFLLEHPDGIFKGAPKGIRRIWLINQADTREDRQTAALFLEELTRPTPRPGGTEVFLIGSAAGAEPFVSWRSTGETV